MHFAAKSQPSYSVSALQLGLDEILDYLGAETPQTSSEWCISQHFLIYNFCKFATVSIIQTLDPLSNDNYCSESVEVFQAH